MKRYVIEPMHEPRGFGAGWEPCPENKATCFGVFDNKTDELVYAPETRVKAEEWVRQKGNPTLVVEERTYPDPDGRDFDNLGESPDY